ncbi:OmpA family protein [Alginatibacterium sediminis]|uniref:OmpA family protein n=1 Tax=Alginatibacterium sediminis TaxID=2164068 RepID=A0A420EDJ9_9ALTE|nr:OmpA family protein [Alginatibacterium sediminis]RKF18777.1 OmpA family protein [Alginatibacterium sediminis]
MKNMVLVLACSIGLSGCTTWAEPGKGGFAENELDLLAWVDMGPEKQLGPEHGMLFQSTLLKHQLEILVLEGAELCFPASVSQARLQEQRIFREIEGGLGLDAANDIEIQQRFLNMLEQRLQRALDGSACRIDGLPQLNASALVLALDALVNSNNQFAYDSSDLSPAYQDQLQKVAPLLIASSLAITITGHSDSKGDEAYKQKLSTKRAENVASYLAKQGLVSEQMTVLGIADNAPYLAGDEQAVRLSNRRVTISFLEPSSSLNASLEHQQALRINAMAAL